MKLTRAALNFLVDLFLLLVFLAQLWLVALLHAVFPRTAHPARAALWGLTRDGWTRVYLGVTVLLALTVLLHVILHWTWVVNFIVTRAHKRRGVRGPMPPDGVRTLYGVTLLVTILFVLGALLVAAEFQIRSPAQP